MTFPKSFQVGGSGSPSQVIKNLTAAYVVQPLDNGIVIRAISGSGSITLPVCSVVGVGFGFTFINDSASNIPLIRVSPDTFSDTSTSWSIGIGQSVRVMVTDASLTVGKWKIMQVSGSATGAGSIAIGYSAGASGASSLAIGYTANANSNASLSIGYASIAGANYSTAIGLNSSQGGSVTSSGTAAMALGGSYASGTDSFAAANADNTGTYGAQGANSIAIGLQGKVTTSRGLAIGYGPSVTGAGTGGVAIGYLCQATNSYSVALGGTNNNTTIASGISSYAFGDGSRAVQQGKYAYSSGNFSAAADTQQGILIVRASTTDATATVATSDGAAASTTNQVILTDNQSMTFNALITARQNTTGDTAAWNVSGCIKRGSGAGTTALVGTAVSLASGADTGAATWTAVCTADTTNGGLKITVTGQAAKTIRWSATVYTNELAG